MNMLCFDNYLQVVDNFVGSSPTTLLAASMPSRLIYQLATGFVHDPWRQHGVVRAQAVTASVGNLANGSAVSGVLSTAMRCAAATAPMTSTCRAWLERGEHALRQLPAGG